MNNLRRKLFSSSIIIGMCSSMLLTFMPSIVIAEKNNTVEARNNHYLSQPATDWGVYKIKEKVKAIFVTGNSFGHPSKYNELLEIAQQTEINSMVIDVKDDGGVLTYESQVPLAIAAGANDVVKVSNTELFTDRMKEIIDNDVYPIARIVTFKDKIIGFDRPDLAIKDKNGGIWKDNKGNAWLNPYNEESWEYPIQLAEEAATMGFKEIQFDYVRFPTDGNRDNIDYGQVGKDKTKAEAISGFLSYARERLHKKGVYVSADVFGDIISVKGDSTIGQQLESLGENTDILSPMVYPSHYGLGFYGVKYPDTKPYEIVNRAMEDAVKRLSVIPEDQRATIRPWLQDFSAPWLKKAYGSNYITYGPKEVRAQIKATYDAGLEEWILWNAANRYTEGALEKE
ncbi:putative glycoside hydrolase [Clostridium sp. D2Q-11]|uniref:Glycoside hydrolase n=1 Tax=Anaeromonas frigoriresistens TaxID=2683708 RepID=A0A942UPJ9_9FIRM|nr:putative glycoside hydrolase [Anaeromonas frigoriresistens]MBS4536838.1 putative glycoside hydrolase [Anaeromonas frigoriresistens]